MGEPVRVPMMMDQAEAERITGYAALPPELFDWLPIGRRIIVVREKARDREGSIIIPERAQDARAVGWVVAAGPDIGLPSTVPSGGRWPWDPALILGAKVVFGAWKGQAMKPDATSLDASATWVTEAGGLGAIRDDFQCPFRAMTDMDIFSVNRHTLGESNGNE